MDKERLKKIRESANWQSWRKYGLPIEPEDVETVLALIDSALAEPSDADVADAIEDFEKIKSNYMRTAKAFDGSRDPIYAESCKSIGRYDLAITALRQIGSTEHSTDSTRATKPTDEAVGDCSTCIGCECEPPLGETVQDCKAYVKREPTDEAVQRAIYWQEHIKKYHQDKWKHAEPEWRAEPGAQSQQDELMASFDLAIQGLRQMRSEQPCEPPHGVIKNDFTYNITAYLYECIACNRGFYAPDTPNYCPNCGRKLVG